MKTAAKMTRAQEGFRKSEKRARAALEALLERLELYVEKRMAREREKPDSWEWQGDVEGLAAQMENILS